MARQPRPEILQWMMKVQVSWDGRAMVQAHLSLRLLTVTVLPHKHHLQWATTRGWCLSLCMVLLPFYTCFSFKSLCPSLPLFTIICEWQYRAQNYHTTTQSESSRQAPQTVGRSKQLRQQEKVCRLAAANPMAAATSGENLNPIIVRCLPNLCGFGLRSSCQRFLPPRRRSQPPSQGHYCDCSALTSAFSQLRTLKTWPSGYGEIKTIHHHCPGAVSSSEPRCLQKIPKPWKQG